MTFDQILLLIFIGITTVLGVSFFFRGRGGGSGPAENKLAAAESLNEQIERLKKESIRDSEEFKRRLREHRARYGSPKNGDGPGPA